LFVYALPEYAHKYSLGGILWLPVLVAGLCGLVRDAFRGGRRSEVRPLSAVVALDAALLCGSAFLVRWMTHSGAPERFLVPAYGLGLAIVGAQLGSMTAKRPGLGSALALVLAYVIYIPLRQQVSHADALRVSPVPIDRLDAPFTEALERIPSGSHILLVGSQGVADYPLFAPREGYPNKVTSWGRAPFSAQGVLALVDEKGITHVLVESDRAILLDWMPPLRKTAELVAALAAAPGLVEVPLDVDGMRLFETEMARELRRKSPGRSFAPEIELAEVSTASCVTAVPELAVGVDRPRTPALETTRRWFPILGGAPDSNSSRDQGERGYRG
jgi:hypothetical protein